MIHFQTTITSLPSTFYREVQSHSFPEAELILFNEDLAKDLELPDFALNDVLKNFGATTQMGLALAYSGHQFGHFNPHLGDGRALLLGEIETSQGKRFDIQLKGSGPTPFSRRGDGFSALGPVLREYMVSEAMHALNVPTTRALCAISTNSPVYRQETEPGGVFTRVASSHIRIGTFEYIAARGQVEDLTSLFKYVCHRHYPSDNIHHPDELLLAYGQRLSKLVAKWMSLGFIHGVMNTDNMAISGETIDYGPCAFMDEYQSDQVFSFIDRDGRYRYSQQIPIALWNLARLAEALLPLGDSDSADKMRLTLSQLSQQFKHDYLQQFARKFGANESNVEFETLLPLFLNLMQLKKLDFTNTFSNLESIEDSELVEVRDRIMKSLSCDSKIARAENPIVIPRNHLVQKAISAAYEGDFSVFREFTSVFAKPFQKTDHVFCQLPLNHERVTQTFCGT